jgi:hypothetical protein
MVLSTPIRVFSKPTLFENLTGLRKKGLFAAKTGDAIASAHQTDIIGEQSERFGTGAYLWQARFYPRQLLMMS